MTVSGARCLIYFTNLSNILVSVSSACMLPQNFRNLNKGSNVFPKSVFLFKYAAAISVFVTLMTCVLFLGPMNVIMNAAMGSGISLAPYLMYFRGNTFFLHFLTPLLAIVSVGCFERSTDFKKAHVWLGLIPTVLYSIVYFYQVVLVGFSNGGWYDSYGFTFGGKPFMAPVSAFLMYLGTWALSALLWKINSSSNKSRSR